MSIPTKRADFDVNEFSSGVELEEYQREESWVFAQRRKAFRSQSMKLL